MPPWRLLSWRLLNAQTEAFGFDSFAATKKINFNVLPVAGIGIENQQKPGKPDQRTIPDRLSLSTIDVYQSSIYQDSETCGPQSLCERDVPKQSSGGTGDLPGLRFRPQIYASIVLEVWHKTRKMFTLCITFLGSSKFEVHKDAESTCYLLLYTRRCSKNSWQNIDSRAAKLLSYEQQLVCVQLIGFCYPRRSNACRGLALFKDYPAKRLFIGCHMRIWLVPFLHSACGLAS